MNTSFRRFEILLPLRFNDGTEVPDSLVADTVLELRKQFGAVSCGSCSSTTCSFKGRSSVYLFAGPESEDEMVFTTITDKAEIAICQNRLEKELKGRGTLFHDNYTTRGYSGDVDAYYLAQFHISYWCGSTDNRFVNHFGKGKSTDDVFQINVPKAGLNRNIRGGFLKNGSAICVLHRGSLGGGRKDGSHNLCDIFKDLVSSFDDNGQTKQGVVLPFLDSSNQLESDFLSTIKRIVDDIGPRLGRTR